MSLTVSGTTFSSGAVCVCVCGWVGSHASIKKAIYNLIGWLSIDCYNDRVVYCSFENVLLREYAKQADSQTFYQLILTHNYFDK